MEKTFHPADIESRWYQEWETQGYFAPAGGDKAYSIMIPPPNVTGSLHMGHGFQEAIMDALIRYHRMLGYNTEAFIEEQPHADGDVASEHALDEQGQPVAGHRIRNEYVKGNKNLTISV